MVRGKKERIGGIKLGGRISVRHWRMEEMMQQARSKRGRIEALEAGNSGGG
jgi:hypothetical protein